MQASHVYPRVIQTLTKKLRPLDRLPQQEGRILDGRIDSWQKEQFIIKAVQDVCGTYVPESARCWYDIMVYDDSTGTEIPVNIKMTRGKHRDNIKNLKGIAYSLSTLPHYMIPSAMSCNRLLDIIEDNKRLERDPLFEYYYLFVNKDTGEHLIKSLCDIKHLYPSGANWLQACMKEEMQCGVYSPSIQESYRKIRHVLAESYVRRQRSCDKLCEFIVPTHEIE
jgi:hypothetical protein